MALFSAIRNDIYARTDLLTEQVLSKNISLALITVLTLLTLWVMVQGYLIATGRSQEGSKGFLFSLGKTYFIIMMALFIGFAPIFILCLLFKKTTPIFQKWLQYGLATIFSTVLLGVMTDISMELIENLWGSKMAGDFFGELLAGKSSEGVMQTVTQQLGVGLILSTLLITVPPMAGMWFNGVMASFSPYSAIREWNSSGAGSGLPPHMGGSSQQMTEDKVHQQYKEIGKAPDNSQVGNVPNYFKITDGGTRSTPQPEGIKQNSSFGNAVSPSVNAAMQTTPQVANAARPQTAQKGEKA